VLATKGWLAISESVGVRLREYLEALEKNPDIKNTQSVLPCDFKAVSAAATLFIKSLLSGIDSASRKNNFDDTLDINTLPFDEAVAYLKKRDVLTKTDYDALADKMKFRAFTASRVADGDLLKRINGALIQNETAGGTLKDFLKLTNDELLDKVGMGPNAGWYWETVYRTNMQTAYNTGRAIELNEVPPLALEFIAIDDTRTSDICKPYAASRVILPPDDPFWKTHWPPLHFNCRSTVRGIYDEDELPDNFTRPTETGHTAKGFGRYPLANDDWWRELESQAKRAAEYGVQREIEAAREKLLGKDASSYIYDNFDRKERVYSIDEDLRAVNPQFNISNWEYTNNCQRCVLTWEMRRRGYMVTALGAIKGHDDIASGNNWIHVLEHFNPIKCKTGNGKTQIKKQMGLWGDGARAAVYVQWTGKISGGHVFVAEQHNGKTFFYDPQNPKRDAENFFNKCEKGLTFFGRMDTLGVSELILKCCTHI